MKKIKRIFAAFTAICILTAFMVIPANFAAEARKLGDADNDGSVTVVDATQIQRELADFIIFDAISERAADVDCDGSVTILDATAIQRWLADFSVPYPIDKPIDPYADESQKALDALKARYDAARGDASADAPVLMRSYDTENFVLSNSAYTYDNALAAMAFLSNDEKAYAEKILDAFVYASEHDRYKPGRIRNAYAAGNIHYVYEGREIAALPGWWDYSLNQWCEDPSQIGCNVGNTSYAVLAMLQYDAVCESDRYLPTAKALREWILDECTDGTDGFTAGYQGSESDKDAVLKYKSTEHNIDAYAAFKQLYAVTGEKTYLDAAESALRFINSMYDSEKGLFYVGTDEMGGLNKSVIVLDAQVWNAMALGDIFISYTAALDLVDSMKLPDGGYPFCQENKNGGWWAEGTAFTALMFLERGEGAKFIAAMDRLCSIQLDSGLFPAATVNHLSTGIYFDDGSPWEYSTDTHIAPTAWFILASSGFDPYRFNR